MRSERLSTQEKPWTEHLFNKHHYVGRTIKIGQILKTLHSNRKKRNLEVAPYSYVHIYSDTFHLFRLDDWYKQSEIH
jgi:hypothetical protein